MGNYIIGITGASGSIYAKRLLEILLRLNHNIHLIITEPGLQVIETELGWKLEGKRDEEVSSEIIKLLEIQVDREKLKYYNNKSIGAAIASGSFVTEGMIIVPCSMSTLAGIAHGSSNNLIQRAGDIILKEKRPLVIVPRETPLNTIHLRNMLTLSELGVHIVPAMPAFYQKPNNIDDLVDFIVGRLLDFFRIEHNLFKRWEG